MNNHYTNTIWGLIRLPYRKVALLTQWAISLWKLARVLCFEMALFLQSDDNQSFVVQQQKIYLEQSS